MDFGVKLGFLAPFSCCLCNHCLSRLHEYRRDIRPLVCFWQQAIHRLQTLFYISYRNLVCSTEANIPECTECKWSSLVVNLEINVSRSLCHSSMMNVPERWVQCMANLLRQPQELIGSFSKCRDQSTAIVISCQGEAQVVKSQPKVLLTVNITCHFMFEENLEKMKLNEPEI